VNSADKRSAAARESAHLTETPRPLSVPQLAARWGCSDGLIYKLIKDGRLQCFRPGSLIRISMVEVERFEGQPAVVEVDRAESHATIADNRELEVQAALSPPHIGRRRRKRPPLKLPSL